MDANRDGELSREEIQKGYKNMENKNLTMEDIDKMIHEVDVDNSGTINYQGNSLFLWVMFDRIPYGGY